MASVYKEPQHWDGHPVILNSRLLMDSSTCPSLEFQTFAFRK